MLKSILIGMLFLCLIHAQGQTIDLDSLIDPRPKTTVPEWVTITKDIPIKDYFPFMDSLTQKYDTLLAYSLTEHLLVRTNPWIIDTLANTDYYRLMEIDSFVYDQKTMIVIRKGDSLKIPDSSGVSRLLKDFQHTNIDVNIPEFKLRIFQDSVPIYSFPIRVGQMRERYLAMAGGIVDLRTKTGSGTIVRHARDPVFYNPVRGNKFHFTKRDDNKTTVMPQIPWIETEINGVRNGQLIHPTTNPESLGKAYSNGCIGTKEADAWIIYYHAPLETPIHIRYQLMVKDALGKERELEDIYKLKQ